MTRMVHRLQALAPLAVLLALLVDSAARDADAAGAHRVYYLFDPAAAGQLERARDAYGRTAHLHGVEWIGIPRRPAPAVPFADRPAGELLASGRLAPAAQRWLRSHAVADSGEDQILVVRPATGQAFAGAGTDAERVILAAGLAGAGAQTEVGFTTWGKVKDLFR